MYRLTLSIGYSALVLFSCSERKTSLDNYGLKGKVSKLVEESYFAKKDGNDYKTTNISLVSTSTFNKDGNCTTYEIVNDGRLENTVKYEYNDEQNCVLEEVSDEDGLSYRTKWNYDDGDVVVITIENKEGKTTGIRKLQYENDLIVSGEYESMENGTKLRWQNEYEGDLLVRHMVIDSVNGRERELYEYNSDGLLSKYSEFNNQDSLIRVEDYSYLQFDEMGNWTKKLELSKYPLDKQDYTQVIFRKIVYIEDARLDEVKLVGIWMTNNGTWIEFQDGGEYHNGYAEKIRDIGKWKLDQSNATLTFISDSPDKSKKYKFEFDGEELRLLDLSGELEQQLKKRALVHDELNSLISPQGLHNHPSGNLSASQADISLTSKLKDAGKFLEIPILDHIIINSESYFSFADEGLL